MMTPEDEQELINRRRADALRESSRDATLTNMTEQRNAALVEASEWKKKYGDAVDDLMVARDAERYALRSAIQSQQSEAGCVARQKELEKLLKECRDTLDDIRERFA